MDFSIMGRTLAEIDPDALGGAGGGGGLFVSVTGDAVVAVESAVTHAEVERFGNVGETDGAAGVGERAVRQTVAGEGGGGFAVGAGLGGFLGADAGTFGKPGDAEVFGGAAETVEMEHERTGCVGT